MTQKRNQSNQEEKIKKKKRKPYRKPELTSGEMFEANVLQCNKVPAGCQPGPVKYT